MDQIKIGKFLVELRKKAGLTQEALGERIGVTNKTVSRWETGTYLPDIDTFLVLAKLYGVNVSELLCGEYLSDENFRYKSEEAVVTAVNDRNAALRKAIRIAVVLFICLTLAFLSVFAILFLATKSEKLDPLTNPRVQPAEKIACAKVTVPEGSAGEDVILCSDSEIAVRLDLDGFVQADAPNTFIKTEKQSFLIVRAFYAAEFPLPTTAELQRFFSDAGIYRLTDKILYAGSFDFGKISVFSSDRDIDMAIGCHMLLQYMDFANRNETERGEFREIGGKWHGFMVSNGEPEHDGNVWTVTLEDRYRLIFLTIKDDEIGASAESVASWLASVGFVD